MESQTERERQLEQEEECIQPAAEFLRTVPVLEALFNLAIIRAAAEIAIMPTSSIPVRVTRLAISQSCMCYGLHICIARV